MNVETGAHQGKGGGEEAAMSANEVPSNDLTSQARKAI